MEVQSSTSVDYHRISAGQLLEICFLRGVLEGVAEEIGEREKGG